MNNKKTNKNYENAKTKAINSNIQTETGSDVFTKFYDNKMQQVETSKTYENDATIASNVETTGKVIGGASLNVRKGRSIKHDVLTRIPENSEVMVVEEYSDGWAKIITAAGLTGFVMAKYLEI